MDKTPYLQNPETAFFFHSHPYEPPPYYQKKPSGHDEEMSFRVGPSLVFDVQKDHMVVYLVVLGRSTPQQRYLFPYTQVLRPQRHPTRSAPE